MPAPIGMGYNGVDFPGDSDAWANETPADGVGYLYTSPTLPCSLGTLPALANIQSVSWPSAASAVWGMNFTAAAGYDSDSPYCTEEVLASPQTLLADANNPAALPTFKSETIRPRRAALGDNNVANAVPETEVFRPLCAVRYQDRDCRGWRAATGSSIGTRNGAMIVPAKNTTPLSGNGSVKWADWIRQAHDTLKPFIDSKGRLVKRHMAVPYEWVKQMEEPKPKSKVDADITRFVRNYPQ